MPEALEVALGGFEEEPDWHSRFQSNPFPSIMEKPAGDQECLKVPDPLTDQEPWMKLCTELQDVGNSLC